MYWILILISSVLLWTLSVLGQNNPQESFEKRMQLREEMHRRLMDKLTSGNGPDQDLFTDLEQLMNESLSEAFGGMDSFGSISLNPKAASAAYDASWKEGEQGRTLVIHPKDPKQQLDINVQNNLITIKGKQEVKTQFGTSLSSFSNSFNVPQDVDGSKVKITQKEGKILVHLPYSKIIKKIERPQENERIPIPSSEDEVTI